MPTLPVFCGKDCGGDACPLLATVENGRVTRVFNNPAGGKYIKGCSRGFALPLETYASDRILTPLIRTGPRGSGQFREASWDEALQLTAERLGEVKAKYGPNAILNWGSAGSTGALHSTSTLLRRFLNLFGGSTRLTGSYSNGAAAFVLPYVLGDDWTRSGWDAATLQDSEMIILWGANILETRLGSEVPQRLVEAKQRGAQIVVIDPRRTVTAKKTATWWLPIRPGTDAALMLAVLQVLFTEGLADRSFIEAHSVGFDALEGYVLGRNGSAATTPEWAEPVCGLPAAEIRRFARAYAAAKPAMLLPGYSIQRVFAGEETFRLSIALQIATANFGVRGGSTGSLNNRLATPRVGKLPVPWLDDQPTVPVLRWPDAILEGTRGGFPSDIHAVYVMGCNAIIQGGDVRKGMAAMEQVDFSVCHEMFMTPTARYCDVILPVATALEKEDIGIPWLGNYLLYKSALVPPAGQARNDYDILWDLANRLGFGEEFSEGRSASQWIERFIEESEISDVAAFRRSGIYQTGQERVGLAEFSADPAGHPLTTPSGKVEIASPRYAQETGGTLFPTWQPQPQDGRYPLSLVTPKSNHRTHSQGSNIPAIRQKEAHVLEIHPLDAAARGINQGDTVQMFNERGTMRIQARLSADLAQGTVSLLEGIWVEWDEQGVDTAGSANLLTATEGTQPAQGAIMHAISVEVMKA